MIIVGIDPGTHCTGYGVVEQHGEALRSVAYGVIDADPPACGGIRRRRREEPLGDRLKRIYDGLTEIIRTHRPDAVALETAFYSKSMTSAFRIGEARAVAILCAAQANAPLAEYAPRAVKMSVVGTGGAHKLQVQRMVRMLLSLREDPEPADAADALAIAICHCQRTATEKRLARPA
jgi:crossover junction endodeoxyribonuclease RuvC